ncbi:MAG: DUF4982 domain-containing protein [Lachnospiraceae bacterium]|nr:DUF4982 domain-containing protein [Lachnospiraceae bacterium]
MRKTVIDENWTFRRGLLDSVGILDSNPGEVVNLPHDGMIDTAVSENAPAGSDSGYFTGGETNYTKFLFIPKEWENDSVILSFDGAMMNAVVDINGSRVGGCHYGYAPFTVDISNYVTFGEENRITVNLNTSMQPASRWYTGSGLYRSVSILNGPKVHIVPDGIYLRTKEVTGGYAFIEGEVEIQNDTTLNHMAEVTVSLFEDKGRESFGSAACEGEPVAFTKQILQVGGCKTAFAKVVLNVKNPKLWDVDEPNLYQVKVSAKDLGVFRTHLVRNEERYASLLTDEETVLFGIRTITADSIRGLLINKKTVKLKGGCVHHDNGLLGAVSLYESEARKIRKLKEVGFNAIRTAHNPPSSALVEACDREGMYIFDEAFDAWGIGKRGGDYHQFFDTDWEKDITAFVKRDRLHPSVIMWSTGNEIPERGGVGDGYMLADKLARKIKDLDPSRPVSNGICSLWAGLDDLLAKGQNQNQNASDNSGADFWEKNTEAFANSLDVVGYNYMEDLYERDHELYPERVILGSENFPREVGFRWPEVLKRDYCIGEFTWTAWDYIGEAGIGKSVYHKAGDPEAPKDHWELMPWKATHFPWRLANDADFDINGNVKAQGEYRSVVFGNGETKLFTMHPDVFDKNELTSMWGFPDFRRSWSYKGYEGKNIEIIVVSGAEEVEVLVNGKSLGKKAVEFERKNQFDYPGKRMPMPFCARFETVYEAGKVEAISYCSGREVSRDELVTAGDAAGIRLVPEKTVLKADGHDAVYVGIEVVDSEGRFVPDAEVELEGCLEIEKVIGEGKRCDVAILSGFGSGNPITDENYKEGKTKTYRGRAMAIVRSGYENGDVTLSVEAPKLGKSDSVEINCL